MIAQGHLVVGYLCPRKCSLNQATIALRQNWECLLISSQIDKQILHIAINLSRCAPMSANRQWCDSLQWGTLFSWLPAGCVLVTLLQGCRDRISFSSCIKMSRFKATTFSWTLIVRRWCQFPVMYGTRQQICNRWQQIYTFHQLITVNHHIITSRLHVNSSRDLVQSRTCSRLTANWSHLICFIAFLETPESLRRQRLTADRLSEATWSSEQPFLRQQSCHLRPALSPVRV